MLRSLCLKSARTAVLRSSDICAAFSSSSVTHSHHPNAPLDLDPSFRALLKDADMSLLRHKARHVTEDTSMTPSPRELEVFPHDPLVSEDYLTSAELDSLEPGQDGKEGRKSPAALFGSQRIGAVILPFELQKTITRLISESDKPTLRMDAKRLFSDASEDQEVQWDSSYEVKYKSWRQAAQHAERDGTAFASVALPSHYSVIFAVLDHVKRRIGPEWKVHHVIDWGTGTASGLWAAAHSFQKPDTELPEGEAADPRIANSIVSTYVGIDKRDGLVKIGKRLLQDVDLEGMNIIWRRSFQDDDRVSRSKGADVLALSAFMLSSLPTALARKALVKEMWESGAETMILIDHNTAHGFECIAGAREYLLRAGSKEHEDLTADDAARYGSHVVAPCPHDGACPLFYPGNTKLVCGFSQRLQRPAFVRKTKHSGVGHEDTGYSYVVIRRGPRPTPTVTGIGRIGDVGRRELERLAEKNKPVAELVIDGDHSQPVKSASGAVHEAGLPSIDSAEESGQQRESQQNKDEVEAALRLEAYNWPRLVFPPLKKSGHIILDGCTREGKIMRMTIPKSQGKQPYYDARKSTWGDIFPHDPKNPPQERNLPKRTKSSVEATLQKKSSMGQRDKVAGKLSQSHNSLSEHSREATKRLVRWRAREKAELTDYEPLDHEE